MSHETDPFDEPDDGQEGQLTELVAYLDGELSDDESIRVERQLATNAPLRGYAESLDRTWRLLDSLGEAPASGQFTQKTLASISAVSAQEDSVGTKPAFSRWVSGFPLTKAALWTFVGFVAGSAGLLMWRSTQIRKADTEEVQMLRQLDMLQQFPQLHAARSAEFLKQVAGLKLPDDLRAAPAEGQP